MDIAWTLVFVVSISVTNKETVIHGMPYKFTLLNRFTIMSLWEIGHNFALKIPNWVRPMALERRLIGLLQDQKLDIEDLKWQRYTRFNIELLEGEKKLDHVLSRVVKDQTFYVRKAKQVVAEGSMTRAATKVHNSSKKFIIWSLQVGSTAYNHCKGIFVLSHCKYIIEKIVLVSICQGLKRQCWEV